MIKHEHMDTRSADNVKLSANDATGGAQTRNVKRTEYEKDTITKSDGKKEAGLRPRDMIHFETTTEMIAFQHKNRPLSQEKANAAHTANMNYASHTAKTDVEKNIDEAERYINQMAKRNAGQAVAKAEQKSQKPLPSTMELNAFAPKLPFEDGNTSVYVPKAASPSGSVEDEPTRAFLIGDGMEESTRLFRTDGNAYEPTRAFRVDDPADQTRMYGIGGITGQTRAFSPLGGVTGQTRAYRSAGVITEQTRAYQTGGAITEQTKAYGIAPEADGQTGVVGTSTGRSVSFEETSDTASANDTKDTVNRARKPRKQKETPVRFEYTSPMQNKKIASDMEMHCKSVLIRLCSAFFWAIALFLMENFAVVRELFPTRLSYVTVDWVITLVCAILALDRMIEAVRSIFRWKPSVSCITVLAFIFSVTATAACLFEKTDGSVTLCNFPFAVCTVLDLLFLYYKRHRDMHSFSLLSSPRDKRAIVIGDSEKERLSEAEYSMNAGKTENVKFGAVKDVDFVDGYFAHAAETPKSQAPLKIFLPVCFAVSVIFFCASFWIAKHTVPQSLGVAYTAFMMCAPCSVFLAYCYPLYLAARRAHSYHSAILCDRTPDAYSDVSMVVFRDTEAISSGKAKVKSIRLYGDRKIDNAIYYASSIYSAVGGPLAEVFRNAALNSVSSDNVQILEVSSEGVCAMVDDKNIVIGRPSYMEEQCFETMYETGDDEYDGKTNKRILYLACDQFIIAKFYIQYSISTDFLYIANRLLSAGYGISVRTADPCLDDGIFYENKIDPEQNAIRISRACLQRGGEESVPASCAGIVSCGDTKELTKTLLLCKKLENVRRTNLVLNVVASVFGVAVMALVTLTGNAPSMLSIYPALYQLFWILPTYFVSKVYL